MDMGTTHETLSRRYKNEFEYSMTFSEERQLI